MYMDVYYVCVYIDVCMYMRVYVCICVYVYMYMCICVNACINEFRIRVKACISEFRMPSTRLRQRPHPTPQTSYHPSGWIYEYML